MSNDNNPWSVPAPQESYPASQGSASYPASQGSASYPASQGSASYPANQQPASYPGSQPSASYPTGQASAPYDGGATAYAQPQQPAPYAGQDQGQFTQPYAGQPQAMVKPSSRNDISALFDFGFRRYATRSIVKVFYILNFIYAVGIWIVPGIFWLFFAGIASSVGHSGDGGPFVIIAVIQFLTGWIGSLIYLMLIRMICEFFVHQQSSTESLNNIEAKIGA